RRGSLLRKRGGKRQWHALRQNGRRRHNWRKSAHPHQHHSDQQPLAHFPAHSRAHADPSPVTPTGLTARCGEMTTISAPGYRDCGEFSIVFRLFFSDQDFTLAGVIGLPDDPLLLHSFHEGRGTVIPDLQPALNVAGRSLAITHDDSHGLLIEVGALALAVALAHSGRIEDCLAASLPGPRNGPPVPP